jgi:transposase
MRRIRQVLQLHFGSHASAGDRRDGRRRTKHGAGLSGARGRGRAGLAVAAGSDGRGTGEASVRGPHSRPGARRYVEPDWSALAREMKRPGVNLSVLFEEYQGAHSEGYAYSRFCQLYRAFERRLSPTMRQTHVAGARAFVDYSGKKVPIVDPLTGEVRMAELFIAVLGASNLTFADATWTRSLPDWIGAHVRMFRFFGSVPRLLIPDNLKSGIIKASFCDPEINRSFAKMAAHYNVGVVPARPRAWRRLRGCGRRRRSLR